MCEKLADHKTTVYVHMFNSCFHLESASQDRHFRSKFVYTTLSEV